MNRETLQAYLKSTGLRYDDINEFWAALMNETQGQITNWLLESGIKNMEQLVEYLRPNQIKNMAEIKNGR